MSTTYSSQGTSMTTNDTNIVLVHGSWSDESVWSKIIPILIDSGHKALPFILVALGTYILAEAFLIPVFQT
ncbi:MAG: hypothetical protein ACRD5B_08600 [Nitrososphaeraceae archaeon]